ncbi:hypothetical protein CLV24_12069 [Pontibacter ummariensis]|uniref:Uncharacterized protein n=2 Tax=Pontibacter ummariensis TaxID=1610492 RepID=A0A239J7Y3_9BACT|nr:hypothetical protein CLV24_12069 [Pontibacter ummariensis]SNT01363.1 hypothetical protein SAMN06296052_12068 [Pontibacter ummariensis]
MLGLLLLAFSCSPENEEVADEQVDVVPVPEALDSIASTNKDALRTDENNVSPTVPLPQPLMQQLTTEYQGWEQPTLAEGAQERGAALPQGPFIVRGDFNGDNLQDVALQLEKDGEVIVLAALHTEEGVYQLHELKRDILFNERGVLQSLYYLYLAEENEEILSVETAEELDIPYDVVALGMEDNVTAFIFTNGQFKEVVIAE